MTERHVPVRTCIGCRGSAPRDTLVRHVLRHDADGAPRVVCDDAGRLNGRGAWLHDDDACHEQAVKRRAFRRSLRITGDIPARGLERDPNEPPSGSGHVTKPGMTEEEAGPR